VAYTPSTNKIIGTANNITYFTGNTNIQKAEFVLKKKEFKDGQYYTIDNISIPYEKTIPVDTTNRSFEFDVKTSGHYRVVLRLTTDTGKISEILVSELDISMPKKNVSTDAFSTQVDDQWTTIKIHPGYKITNLNDVFFTSTKAGTIDTNLIKISNYSYDDLEINVEKTSTPTPPPVEPPKTSTTITLQIGNKTMYVNGKAVYLDSAPILQNARTLLPIRAIAEALGAKVDWDDKTQKVTIGDKNTKIELWIGKPTAYVNGKQTLIDPNNTKVVPITINGRTMLPVRFVAESLGAEVEWNEAQQKVTITK